MTPKTIAVVFVPKKTQSLKLEVAGRPIGDHLLENLRRCPGLETPILAQDGARSFPRGKKRSLLMIDARACFSQAALKNALARAAGTINCTRVIESIGNLGQTSILATYLPAGFPFPLSKLSDLFNPRVLRDASIVEASQLDASQPPLLIASYEDAAEFERRLLLDRAALLMRRGVRLHDPKTVYIRGTLTCGSNVEIDANVVIEGHVALGSGVKIGANSILINSRIGDATRINPFSLVENSTVGSGGFVGPYGRIRPGSVIGDGVQIGNYVEIKNSKIGARCRINHHSFVGDAVIADQVTIGAGTITCNHDGAGTNRTIIESGAYIGSGCSLVAPLRVRKNATIGAGSTVTSDVPAAKLTLARSRQITIDDWKGPRTRRGNK